MKKIGKYIIITEDEEFKFFKFTVDFIHIARSQYVDASRCRNEFENMNKKWLGFYCKTFSRK